MPKLDRRSEISDIKKNQDRESSTRIDPYLKCLLQRRLHCNNPFQRKHIRTGRTHTKPTTNSSKAKPQIRAGPPLPNHTKIQTLPAIQRETLTLVQEGRELLHGVIAGAVCHCRGEGDPELGLRARTDEAGAA